jgi:hypothetical protein
MKPAAKIPVTEDTDKISEEHGKKQNLEKSAGFLL